VIVMAESPIGRRGFVVVSSSYLLLSLALWWGVWGSHPTSTTTCGCGDAARFLWFFEWPVFALTHGHSLWYSTWLFHPTGINLLNDTSVLALGLALSPITLLFGPVAAMNVALTLSPVLSAMAMFFLLRRWVRWQPAAFVGGLCYGFSPFLVSELALNQLNIAFLVGPPLLIIALDECLIRQRRSPYRTGSLLAALVVVQFFAGIELLLIMVIVSAIGISLLVGSAAVHAPDALRARASHAVKGVATAVLISVAVLAYPVWFFLRGPAHLSGPIWSNGPLDRFGNLLTSFWSTSGSEPLGMVMRRFGGYQGPTLPGIGYLGLGTLVVVLIGAVVWRHDRRLLFFGTLALVCSALSLGPGHGYWVVWQAAERVPGVADIVEIRFTAITMLCLAVMVSVVVDRTRSSALLHRPRGAIHLGVPAAMVVTVIALVPSAIALWPNLPITTRSVVVPPWFEDVGSKMPAGQVVLAYPVPFSGIQAPMAWQAIDGMGFALAGGGGPEGESARAGAERAGFDVLANASLPLGRAPGPTAANLVAVRRALEGWKVTVVVVPDDSALPPDEQGRGSTYAVGLLTAVLGRAPVYQRSAWVWQSVQAFGTARAMSQAAFDACTTGTGTTGPHNLAVAACVLAAPPA
jgi:hypothetical protein